MITLNAILVEFSLSVLTGDEVMTGGALGTTIITYTNTIHLLVELPYTFTRITLKFKKEYKPICYLTGNEKCFIGISSCVFHCSNGPCEYTEV